MGESQPPRYVLGTTPECFVQYGGKTNLRFALGAFGTTPEHFAQFGTDPNLSPASTVASKFIADMFGASSSSPVRITSLPNERGDKPGERPVATRDAEKIENHLHEWDRPGRALYF